MNLNLFKPATAATADAAAVANAPAWRLRSWRVLLSCLLLMGLLLVTQRAQAQLPDNITAGEMALLPDYCRDVQATTQYTDRTGGNPSPRAPMWISQMGETFWAMHHHCWALIRVHRARRPGLFEPVRVGTLKGAINDYVYVLKHEKPGFPLKPEIYVRIGEAYAMLPSPGDALEWYEKARQEKPDYWPGYTWAADSLLVIGRRKEAIELLESGLAIIPGNPEITRKLDSIKRGEAPKGAAKPRPSPSAVPAARTAANAEAPSGAAGSKSPTPSSAPNRPSTATTK